MRYLLGLNLFNYNELYSILVTMFDTESSCQKVSILTNIQNFLVNVIECNILFFFMQFFYFKIKNINYIIRCYLFKEGHVSVLHLEAMRRSLYIVHFAIYF